MRLELFSTAINRQRGAAVIVAAVIILVLITLLVFMSSRSTLMSIRLGNNDFKARQAFEAAESGLAYAVQYFKEKGLKEDARLLLCASPNPVVEDFNTVNHPSFSFMLDGTCAVELAGDPVTAVRIGVEGKSANGEASRTIYAVMAASGVMPGAVTIPVTTASNAGSLGSATIQNAFSNITVRSGSATTVGGSATTFICDHCGTTSALLDLDAMHKSGATNVYRNSGVDIIENDPILSSMSNDDFFNGFFAASRDDIGALADIVADSDFNISNDPNTGLPYMGKVIVVDGDLTIAANTRIGCNKQHPNVCIYPNDIDPVTLIVLGDLTVAGTVDFYGFIYVGENSIGHGGNIKGNGTFSAAGAVALEGTANVSGNFSLKFHPRLASGSTGASGGAGLNLVPGTWRDF